MCLIFHLPAAEFDLIAAQVNGIVRKNRRDFSEEEFHEIIGVVFDRVDWSVVYIGFTARVTRGKEGWVATSPGKGVS